MNEKIERSIQVEDKIDKIIQEASKACEFSEQHPCLTSSKADEYGMCPPCHKYNDILDEMEEE